MLSIAQEQVFNCFLNYREIYGIRPTFEKAGKILKMSSPGVFYHYKKLKKMGYLTGTTSPKTIVKV